MKARVHYDGGLVDISSKRLPISQTNLYQNYYIIVHMSTDI